MGNDINKFSGENNMPITRLTALWALSESLLGGMLHAAHIPLRGMIISSAAVIIIFLIANFSEKKGTILKSTLIVLIIKGVISPHTPFAAYLAVFMQGLLGEIFFYKRKFLTFASIAFGFTIGILTGSQRIITYTIIFGITFWQAVNEFISYVIIEFFKFSKEEISINFSLFLIGTYVFIHAAIGTAAGYLASKLPQKINSEKVKNMILDENQLLAANRAIVEKKKDKKPWWKKLSYALFLIIIGFLLIISYVNPESIKLGQKSLLLMIFRALAITLTWFFFLSPLVMKIIKRLLQSRENVYAAEITRIISHFPIYINVVSIIWKSSLKEKGLKSLSYFLTSLIANILILKIPD